MMEENYCLRWERHNENFLKTVENVYKKTAMIDVTLSCEKKLYPAHKLILSSCSDYFSYIFENTYARDNLIVVLNDIPCKTLEYLLEFIYIGEINVKQTELSPLIRAAQYLKIKGLVANDICFSDYETLQLSEACNEPYGTVDSNAIKSQSTKNNEVLKDFLYEDQVQMIPEYPVIYSQVKLESVNKNRGSSANGHEGNMTDPNAHPVGSEAELKDRETSDKNSANVRNKKLKGILHKTSHDDSSAHNFSGGHAIFLPIDGKSSAQENSSQVELLRPMQEINYAESNKPGESLGGGQGVIFTEMMPPTPTIKHVDPSSSQKRITETLISTTNCAMVFEPPAPLQSDQNRISVTTMSSVPQLNVSPASIIVPPPQTSDSSSVLKEGNHPRILKMSDAKKNSKSSRKYLCSECPYSSDFSSNVRRHIRKHTGEKPYKCSICNINFLTCAKFKIHSKSVHSQ